LALTKIGFYAHPQTSLCQRETGFDRREMQDARPELCSLGALSTDVLMADIDLLKGLWLMQ